MAHILLVDDSPTERLRVGHLLKKGLAQIAVSYAENGKAALAALASDVPDLIVTDLRMPEMDGLSLVESIRSVGLGVPVILMTSYGNEEIALQALSAGAASYVPKSVLDIHLVKTVESVLALSQGKKSRQRVLKTLTDVESHFLLENDLSLISPLISYIQEQIATMQLFDKMQVTRIGVALHESLTNAVHHGNLELDSELRQVDEGIYYQLAEERRRQAPYAERRVRVVATLSSSEARFVIADEGPGFNMDAIRDPTDELNLGRMGGRGLLLIRSFMDEVRHNSSGNTITLVKRVVRGERRGLTSMAGESTCTASDKDNLA